MAETYEDEYEEYDETEDRDTAWNRALRAALTIALMIAILGTVTFAALAPFPPANRYIDRRAANGGTHCDYRAACLGCGGREAGCDRAGELRGPQSWRTGTDQVGWQSLQQSRLDSQGKVCRNTVGQ